MTAKTKTHAKATSKRAKPNGKPKPLKDAHPANGTIRDEPQSAGPGRPTMYTKELGAEICELTAMRVPLVRICEMPGMPSERTVYAWKRIHPEFQHEYARAREHRADARADRIDDYIEAVKAGTLDPNAARVMIDAEKWQAGKEQPKRYGDRLEVDAKAGLVVVETPAAIKALLEALPELVNGKVLDALPQPALADAAEPALSDGERP
jgi:hypothetical protein